MIKGLWQVYPVLMRIDNFEHARCIARRVVPSKPGSPLLKRLAIMSPTNCHGAGILVRGKSGLLEKSSANLIVTISFIAAQRPDSDWATEVYATNGR